MGAGHTRSHQRLEFIHHAQFFPSSSRRDRRIGDHRWNHSRYDSIQVHHWNEWFSASIYINDRDKLPIQVIMRNIVLSGTMQDANFELMDEPPPETTLKAAMIMVSTIPILFVYPFIQKYFVKGALIGS